MSAVMMVEPSLVWLSNGLFARTWAILSGVAHKSPLQRHGRRRNAFPFEGKQTNALTTAPMIEARESPALKPDKMIGAQHDEAPSLYCDRMDAVRHCTRCGVRTHIRFSRPGFPDVIAYYWKCRRCIRKGTSVEKEAFNRMLFRQRAFLKNPPRLGRVEAGGLTD